MLTYETYLKLTGFFLKNTSVGDYPSILNEQNMAFVNQLQDLRQISAPLCQCIQLLQYHIYTHNLSSYPYHLLDKVHELLKIFAEPETLFSVRVIVPGSEMDIVCNLLRLFTYVPHRVDNIGHNYDPNTVNIMKTQHIQKLFNDLFMYYERFNSINSTYTMNLSNVTSTNSPCGLLKAMMDFISTHADVCVGYLYSIPQMSRHEVRQCVYTHNNIYIIHIGA